LAFVPIGRWRRPIAVEMAAQRAALPLREKPERGGKTIPLICRQDRFHWRSPKDAGKLSLTFLILLVKFGFT